MAERRESLRAVARIEIFDPGRRMDRVPLYVSGNVSIGGMFLITQEPLPAGTNFRISFTLPGNDSEIAATGVVLWSRGRRQASNRQPGMGIKFLEISKKDVDRIWKFINAQADSTSDKDKK